MRGLGCVLAGSVLVTEGLLIAQGRWQEAIPLHLCSVSAIAALCLACSFRQALLDFLWYLGMPGALLALVFPSPAVSAHQALFDAAYVLTHALILLIPAAAVCRGARVRRGRGKQMLLAVHLLALAAACANALLGTDFLFLAAPPSGTPLCLPYALGHIPYLLTLEALVCALLLLTGRMLPHVLPSVFK